MNEELVEVGKSLDPRDAEEARRRPRPDLIDERCAVAIGLRGCPPLGQSMPPSGKNKARCGKVVVLTQHEVGSEVAGGPRFEHRRRVGTELDEEIAQLFALCCVQEDICHVAGFSNHATVEVIQHTLANWSARHWSERPLSNSCLVSRGSVERHQWREGVPERMPRHKRMLHGDEASVWLDLDRRVPRQPAIERVQRCPHRFAEGLR